MDYFKLMCYLGKGNKGVFDIPVEVQKKFINNLGLPCNDIDRSFKQYLCQNLFVNRLKIILLNISFTFITPFVLLVLLIKGLFIKKEKNIEALASLPLQMHFFSEDLLNEFHDINDELWGRGRSLQLKDITFVTKIWSRGICHPYFVCKSIYILSSYSDMIYKYSPKALLSHCEFSFTSSLLTAYCQRTGALHINTMHGDKFYFIRDSYVHFDRFYVWDEHYKKLFISMEAEPSQFCFFVPGNLRFDCSKHENLEDYADYKYYLQINTENELKSIIQTMKLIETSGSTYRIRPHIRYSDINLLRKLVDDMHIENPQEVSIQESISNCKYVIGSFSTVLTQAYYSGKRVVLDDITYKEQYEKLKERQYFLANKETLLLSKMIKNG